VIPQPVPTHEQSGAPLHATVQLPPHFVVWHVCALWHVSVQPPPGHSMTHVAAVQSWVHPPPSPHVIEHDFEPLQVAWQLPPHVSEHVEADSHVYLQPPLEHVSVQPASGGQSQA